MPYTDLISRRALRVLAAQIGNRLEAVNSLENLTAESAEIAESLTEWRLEITSGGDNTPFRAMIRPTGRWHHQIRLDGEARLYARSSPLGNDGAQWILRETVVSPLAAQINDAIQWLEADSDVDGDAVIRVLYAPSPPVVALWLASENPADDRVLILENSAGNRSNGVRLLNTADFLRSLTPFI